MLPSQYCTLTTHNIAPLPSQYSTFTITVLHTYHHFTAPLPLTVLHTYHHSIAPLPLTVLHPQDLLDTDGVRVNCICPEFVDTPLVKQSLAQFSTESKDYVVDMGLIRCVGALCSCVVNFLSKVFTCYNSTAIYQTFKTIPNHP